MYVLIRLTQINITYLLNKTQTPVYRNSSPECAAIFEKQRKAQE